MCYNKEIMSNTFEDGGPSNEDQNTIINMAGQIREIVAGKVSNISNNTVSSEIEIKDIDIFDTWDSSAVLSLYRYTDDDLDQVQIEVFGNGYNGFPVRRSYYFMYDEHGHLSNSFQLTFTLSTGPDTTSRLSSHEKRAWEAIENNLDSELGRGYGGLGYEPVEQRDYSALMELLKSSY